MGRMSYELFSPAWPNMEVFAHYKNLPKYVVSTTLTEDDLVSDWGPTTDLRRWTMSRHSRSRRAARSSSTAASPSITPWLTLA